MKKNVMSHIPERIKKGAIGVELRMSEKREKTGQFIDLANCGEKPVYCCFAT
jgi:hypothetical protein